MSNCCVFPVFGKTVLIRKTPHRLAEKAAYYQQY